MLDAKLTEKARVLVLEGHSKAAVKLARSTLAKGTNPVELLEQGFAPALREAGDLWNEGVYFLPELMRSAEAMKAVLEAMGPSIQESVAGPVHRGTAIVGTVNGDIHDIGKTLVGAMLSASGFNVIDLGGDVPTDRFLAEGVHHGARFLCLSALLTTTMVVQRKLIERLCATGLRDKFHVLVGGAPVSQEWADSIGADGYAPDAPGAVKIAESLLQKAPARVSHQGS